MARIRARFKLNKGRKGIAPEKLVRQFEKLIEIANSIAKDAGINAPGQQWLVSDFQNNSVDTLWEHRDLADVRTADKWKLALHYIAATQQPNAKPVRPEFISDRSLAHVSSYSELLDNGEPFVVGIFDSDETPHDKPTWLEKEALEIKELAGDVVDLIEYDGCISGKPHEINMGSERPYFKIRESTTTEVVKCFYDLKNHASVYRALENKDGTVYVYGVLSQSQITGKYGDMTMRYIEPAPAFSDAEFEKFFGAAPDFTGAQESEKHVRKIRGNG